MHLKRWITALVAVPGLIALISYGTPLLFAGFVGVVCVFALWEYYGIVFKGMEKGRRRPFAVLGYAAAACMLWAAYAHSTKLILSIVLLNFMACALVGVFNFKSNPTVPETIFKQVLGTIYIPGLLSCLVMIRNSAEGIVWIYFLLLVVFAGDTGAFYVGTYFGRHKLCPAVSPGKTVEGAIGGVTFNLGAGVIFKHFVMQSAAWGASLVFIVAAGVFGQIGDLFESQLKRAGNIKDSGAILPGHGGVLDRIDALLFAVPVAYFFKEYIM